MRVLRARSTLFAVAAAVLGLAAPPPVANASSPPKIEATTSMPLAVGTAKMKINEKKYDALQSLSNSPAINQAASPNLAAIPATNVDVKRITGAMAYKNSPAPTNKASPTAKEVPGSLATRAYYESNSEKNGVAATAAFTVTTSTAPEVAVAATSVVATMAKRTNGRIT
jgi:hypothetical protein